MTLHNKSNPGVYLGLGADPRAELPTPAAPRPPTPLNLHVEAPDGVGEISFPLLPEPNWVVAYGVIRRRTSPDPEDSSTYVGKLPAPAPGELVRGSDDDVVPGARYIWGVCAIDGEGNESDYGFSGEVTVGSPNPPRFAVGTGISYAAVHRMIAISWDHAESPVGISHYVVTRHGGALMAPAKIEAAGGTLRAELVDRSVEDGVEYQYVVIAVANDAKHSEPLSVYAAAPRPGCVGAGTAVNS